MSDKGVASNRRPGRALAGERYSATIDDIQIAGERNAARGERDERASPALGDNGVGSNCRADRAFPAEHYSTTIGDVQRTSRLKTQRGERRARRADLANGG